MTSSVTDAHGIYIAKDVPIGRAELRVTHPGYIDSRKRVEVEAAIHPGMQADLAMSPSLTDDTWRMVLSWQKYPQDLDTHVYMTGRGDGCQIFYDKRKMSCWSMYGVEGSLDVDNTKGYGPETSTIKDLKKCKGKPHCKMVFKVHNYSKSPGWPESKAVVKVYNGQKEVATYRVGRDGVTTGEPNTPFQFWSVFSLDGNTGTVSPCSTPTC